jgi:glycosyltransferase involved in cell wall biosynthesis
MKIIATCRTLNEEANVGRFVKAYSGIADKVLIADGGSTDNTVEFALHAGARVRPFREVVNCPPGGVRNPHGRHINFCLNWAWEEGADWVIFDDCDCVPTLALQRLARPTLENSKSHVAMVHRLYVYGDDHYFPTLNYPGHSLWAWSKFRAIWAKEENPMVMDFVNIPKPEDALTFDQPAACLHYTFPNAQEVQRKIKFYAATGEGCLMNDPREWAGPLAALPEWAVWG